LQDVLGPSDLIGSCVLDLNNLEAAAGSRKKKKKKKNKKEQEQKKTFKVTQLLKKGLKSYRDYKSYTTIVETMSEAELRRNLDKIR
jgi:hypothetical protein